MTQRITFENEDSLKVKGDGWVMRGEPTQGGYEFTIETWIDETRSTFRFSVSDAPSLGEALSVARPMMRRTGWAVFKAASASAEIAFPSKPVDGKRWWQVWR
jgi:hypothetical protein